MNISKPFIDKLSITFIAELNDSILCTTDTTTCHGFLLVPCQQKVSSRYHYGWSIKTSNGQHLVYLQHTPTQGHHRNTRLDFNPAKIPDTFIPRLSGLLNALISFDSNTDGIYGGAIITRADYAVDFHDIHIDQLLIHVPRKRLVETLRTTRGTTQTIYFGSKKSSNHLIAYDKQEESGLAAPCTRLEYRRKEKVLLAELMASPNHFVGVRVFDLRASPQEETLGPEFLCFQDSCRYRSFAKALNRLPLSLRTQYSEWIESRELPEFNNPDWWNSVFESHCKVYQILGILEAPACHIP